MVYKITLAEQRKLPTVAKLAETKVGGNFIEAFNSEAFKAQLIAVGELLHTTGIDTLERTSESA